MVKLKEVYKCMVCGNIVEVLHVGDGTLVCCGKEMVLMVEHRASEEGGEKHVPVIFGKVVKVGSVAHPMEEGHYIEWIEAASDSGVSRPAPFKRLRRFPGGIHLLSALKSSVLSIGLLM